MLICKEMCTSAPFPVKKRPGKATLKLLEASMGQVGPKWQHLLLAKYSDEHCLLSIFISRGRLVYNVGASRVL
jgi:hypothetical protein